MKRWILVGTAILLVVITGICLSSAAVNPQRFTGIWYDPSNDERYTFENGFLTCGLHDTPCGAYVFSGTRILLYTSEIIGLEAEKELYWSHEKHGDVLSEKPQGNGLIYFTRKNSR